MQRPLIVLDPGHGSYNPRNMLTCQKGSRDVFDAGYVYKQGKESVREIDVNDAITARTALALRARGYDVKLTREINLELPTLSHLSRKDRAYLQYLNNDAPKTLPDRFNERIETGAGRKVIHVSIHADKGNPSLQGVVFHRNDEQLAGSISFQFARGLERTFARYRYAGNPLLSDDVRDIHGDYGINTSGPHKGHQGPTGDVVHGLGPNVAGV